MSLREILEKLVEQNTPVFLCDSNDKKWEARELLNNLSTPMLKKKAHMQPGLYIAEINDSGYLKSVLYKLKQKQT
ncbi:MAG: hypothetical protein GF421_12480 [Candidatus Aminicenantes bacterium]|nr:hypothetical protein [Candidatus Aminicenantes bacterium]